MPVRIDVMESKAAIKEIVLNSQKIYRYGSDNVQPMHAIHSRKDMPNSINARLSSFMILQAYIPVLICFLRTIAEAHDIPFYLCRPLHI